MLRSILRSAAGSQPQSNLTKILLPTTGTPAQLTASRSFASKKKSKPAADPKKLQQQLQQANKNQSKKKGKKYSPQDDKKVNAEQVQITPTEQIPVGIREERLARLAQVSGDKSLDVGPNGRPLFIATPSLSQLSRRDVCHYMEFR